MTISIVRSARRRIAAAAALAAAGLLLGTLSATAADMPVQPRPPVVERPLWTGFYVGVHGGGGWGSSSLIDPSYQVAYNPVTVNSSGWLVGGQVGANWQFDHIVIGAELDASGSLIKGRTDPDPTFFFSGFQADFRALATGTGRVGYAAGRFLGYAKFGLAWANIDFQSGLGVPVPNPGTPLDVDHQRSGLTAGAGLEVAIFGPLSAKVEWDYIYFGQSSIAVGDSKLGMSPPELSHQLNLVKAGLNWRFSDN